MLSLPVCDTFTLAFSKSAGKLSATGLGFSLEPENNRWKEGNDFSPGLLLAERGSLS